MAKRLREGGKARKERKDKRRKERRERKKTEGSNPPGRVDWMAAKVGNNLMTLY
jgi:hypothetical protein